MCKSTCTGVVIKTERVLSAQELEEFKSEFRRAVPEVAKAAGVAFAGLRVAFETVDTPGTYVGCTKVCVDSLNGKKMPTSFGDKLQRTVDSIIEVLGRKTKGNGHAGVQVQERVREKSSSFLPSRVFARNPITGHSQQVASRREVRR